MLYILKPVGGGLGNLIFQHNIIFTLAKENKTPIYIYCDYEGTNERPSISYYKSLFCHVNFLNSVEFNRLIFAKRVYYFHESKFFYNKIVTTDHVDVIVISGYFQSFKYFEQCHNLITRTLLHNVMNVYNRVKEKFNNITNSKVSVCIHVRRGDYLHLSTCHPVLPISYYERALRTIIQKQNGEVCVLVFSDDIAYVQQWNIWSEIGAICIMDEPDPLATFIFMSMCDHFIIANSSLSLNACYFNALNKPNTTVVAPRKWFGPNGPEYKIEDLVPPGTILVEY